ncbi:hypothetical protein TKK_0008992 [Trichogramma kaykai]|uniref:Alpha 1,4-glycosyltransferase domain-containing protein n=1 Tax=Trichogramma kaykai TaxID=54128 RepID=A0ABD2X2Z9_9HYME
MMVKKRWLCLAVLLFIFVYTFFYSYRRTQQRRIHNVDVLCYYRRPLRNSSIPNFDELKEKERLSTKRNIFFLETSCSYKRDDEFHLSCRQACAVESAARMNPTDWVHLLFFSPSVPSLGTNELFTVLQSNYSNVNIRRAHLTDYIKGTPVEKWLTPKLLLSSNWPLIHLSDILRLLTLWKFSGIYLDLDIVVTKSLENFKNFVGAQDDERIANGVMGFDKDRLGHRLVEECLTELMKDFRGDLWTHNGPDIVTKVIQKQCNLESVARMINSPSCKGFQVFHPSVFYPIPYQEWERYFHDDLDGQILKLIGKSKIIHVWNKLSKREPVTDKSPYSTVAKQFCPRVFEKCKSRF